MTMKLGRNGRKKWRELKPLLEERENVQQADYDLLEQYCINHEMICLATKSIAEVGLNIVNSAGSIAANPATKTLTAAQKANITIGEKLSLTTLGKKKNNEEEPEDDDWI